jgi:hypothetical protein
MNILDSLSYWKKAHVGSIYYHTDIYALRTIEILDKRVEYWKFFPRTATNTYVSILWLDEVARCLEDSIFRTPSNDEVMNEALYYAVYELAKQELEKEIAPNFQSLLTAGNLPRVEKRDNFLNVVSSYR